MMKLRIALLAALAGAGCSEEDPRPSIILVSWDAVRADHTSLHGYERATTPNLDQLATEALVFERAHTTQPYTMSHMGLLTGLYPSAHGVDENHGLSPRLPTLAERLQAEGYDTVALYHPGWIDERYGFARGFDTFRHHWTAEQARVNLEEELGRLDGGPFFLFLHLFDAHNAGLDDPARTIYDPPAPFRRMWLDDAPERVAAHTSREFYEDLVEPTDAELEGIVALYDGGISYLDSVLGTWVDGWRASGILDDAILVVTTDHGESVGTRGRLYGHGDMYQEGLHVPLVIRWPDGFREGERELGPVSQVDVLPTLLQAAGLEPESWRSGYSLRDGRPVGRPVIAQVGAVRAVIDWPWKLIQNGAGWSAEVYSLDRDPDELKPHATGQQFRLKVAELGRLADAELASRPLPAGADPVELSALVDDDVERLRALGYLGDE